MMELVYVYDEEGFYTSPAIESMVGELQITRFTKDVPPDYIRAKWNGSEWIEGATEEEIENVEQLFTNPEPSPIDMIMIQNAFITEELAVTQSENKSLAETNAFLMEEMAVTQVSNRILAEQQASILLLLAEQPNPPEVEPLPGDDENETPVEDTPSEEEPLPDEEIGDDVPVEESPENPDDNETPVVDDETESPIEEPIENEPPVEDNPTPTPEEGDNQ